MGGQRGQHDIASAAAHVCLPCTGAFIVHQDIMSEALVPPSDMIMCLKECVLVSEYRDAQEP